MQRQQAAGLLAVERMQVTQGVTGCVRYLPDMEGRVCLQCYTAMHGSR
jgi:hypothetical protein